MELRRKKGAQICMADQNEQKKNKRRKFQFLIYEFHNGIKQKGRCRKRVASVFWSITAQILWRALIKAQRE